MDANKITEEDRTILRSVDAGHDDATAIADEVGSDRATVRERLDVMVENGLLCETSGSFELIDSGRRLLQAPGDGSADDRIDVPESVERELAALDLTEDEVAAVRGSVSFLQYWGEATESEIRDAIFSEWPAGYDSRDAWWTDCVESALGNLSRIERPADADSTWRFDGSPGIQDGTLDGRIASGGDTEDAHFGSAKHTIEGFPLSDEERRSVAAAFGLLERRGDAAESDLTDAFETTSPSEYGSIDEWLEACLRPAFESIPGVDRDADGRWTYRATDE